MDMYTLGQDVTGLAVLIVLALAGRFFYCNAGPSPRKERRLLAKIKADLQQIEQRLRGVETAQIHHRRSIDTMASERNKYTMLATGLQSVQEELASLRVGRRGTGETHEPHPLDQMEPPGADKLKVDPSATAFNKMPDWALRRMAGEAQRDAVKQALDRALDHADELVQPPSGNSTQDQADHLRALEHAAWKAANHDAAWKEAYWRSLNDAFEMGVGVMYVTQGKDGMPIASRTPPEDFYKSRDAIPPSPQKYHVLMRDHQVIATPGQVFSERLWSKFPPVRGVNGDNDHLWASRQRGLYREQFFDVLEQGLAQLTIRFDHIQVSATAEATAIDDLRARVEALEEKPAPVAVEAAEPDRAEVQSEGSTERERFREALDAAHAQGETASARAAINAADIADALIDKTRKQWLLNDNAREEILRLRETGHEGIAQGLEALLALTKKHDGTLFGTIFEYLVVLLNGQSSAARNGDKRHKELETRVHATREVQERLNNRLGALDRTLSNRLDSQSQHMEHDRMAADNTSYRVQSIAAFLDVVAEEGSQLIRLWRHRYPSIVATWAIAADELEKNSSPEDAIKAPNGPRIVRWGSSRVTWPDVYASPERPADAPVAGNVVIGQKMAKPGDVGSIHNNPLYDEEGLPRSYVLKTDKPHDDQEQK